MSRTSQQRDVSLPRRTRAEMILRSFFIQATNNFERMLSLGFLFALWPVIKIIYPEPAARRSAIVRHLSFFNTQPYFANCILGVIANAELRGGKNLDAEVASVKEAMMGAFGALGDDLFWTGLMPAAALTALVFYNVLPDYAIIGAVLALIVYNVFHLWARVRLFNVGLRLGRRITSYLKMLRLPYFALAVKFGASFLLGLFTVAVIWRSSRVGTWGMEGALVVTAAVFVSFVVQSLGVRPGICWYLVAAAAVALGIVAA